MSMRIKAIFLALAMLATFNAQEAKASGIPVVDGASIAQDAANFLQTLTHYATELQEMRNQFEQQVKHYQALTDVRGMMNVLNSYYDKLMQLNPEGVLERFDIKDPASILKLTGDTLKDFEKGVKTASDFLASVEKLERQTIDRFAELEKLIEKSGELMDPKDALDLQARIQAEQAMLQNETLKVQLVAQKAQAERYMMEQKQQQTHIEFSKVPAPTNW